MKALILISLLLVALASTDINVDTMTSSQGYKITCSLQSSVTSDIKPIGDINGDNIYDFAIGFPQANIVAIIYGGSLSSTVAPFDACTFTNTSIGFRLTFPIAGSQFGYSIAPLIYDLNADGVLDLAVSAPSYASSSGSGRVYIIYMPKSPRSISYDVTNTGAISSYYFTENGGKVGFGTTLVKLEDKTNDALPEVLAGYASNSYGWALYGKLSASGDTLTGSIGTTQGDQVQPAHSETKFPTVYAKCGDFNNDAKNDVVLASVGPTANYVYILYNLIDIAPVRLLAATVSPAISADNGFSFSIGTNTVQSLGCADIDNDGKQDIFIGLTSGIVYVVYGTAASTLTSLTPLTSSQGFLFYSSVNSYTFGASIAGTADINNDGISDIIIGSLPNAGFIGARMHVIFGSSTLFGPGKLNSFNVETKQIDQGYLITSSPEHIGQYISATEDLNNDGVRDILVACQDQAQAYVIFGICKPTTYLSSRTCVACPSGCETCTGATSCQTCSSNYILKDNFCCTSDQYFNGEKCVSEAIHATIAGVVLGGVTGLGLLAGFIHMLINKTGFFSNQKPTTKGPKLPAEDHETVADLGPATQV